MFFFLKRLLSKVLNPHPSLTMGGLPYQSWEDAKRASTGYESEIILKKTLTSSLLVSKGHAIYERDSVIFDRIEYSWPLLSGLLFAIHSSQVKTVVDFGGSFGTTFRQNFKFLPIQDNNFSWRIIEQPHYVDLGNTKFGNTWISFYESIEGACKSGVGVALFCGSLCYVENPYDILDAFFVQSPDFLIFDRLPVSSKISDEIFIQKIPKEIFEASYPAWIFSRKKMLDHLSARYELIEMWDCDIQPDRQCQHIGMLLKIRHDLKA